MATKGSMYKSFLSREGPQRLDTVEWPKERADAFKGKKFLVTGVMETILRDDLIHIINNSGGHVMSGMSKNLDYLISGRDAGPSKLKKAEEFKLKVLSEEETFELFKKVLDDGDSLSEGEPKAKKTTKRTKAKKEDTDDDEEEEPLRKSKATKKKMEEKSQDKKFSSKSKKPKKEDIEEDPELGEF